MLNILWNYEMSFPTPNIKIYRYQLSANSIQTDILKLLERIKDQYAKSPYVREFLFTIIGQLDNNDKESQIELLTDFVKDNMIYVRDPLGVEYVTSPVQHIKRILMHGYTTGDCDDHAMLLNTFLSAMGMKTRFVGVKLNSSRFNHVISCVKNPDWIDIDPCAKQTKQRIYEEQLTVVD